MKDIGSIKPKPLIGEILPGFTFLSLVLYCYFTAHPCQFEWIISKGGATTIVASGLVFILSWIIGDFFDAFREMLLEDKLIDRFQPLYWDFFFEADREKVDQVEDYYYSYYELNINFAVAMFMFLLSEFLFYLFCPTFIKQFPWYLNCIILLVTVIFAWDAMILRGEIKKNLDKVKPKTK